MCRLSNLINGHFNQITIDLRVRKFPHFDATNAHPPTIPILQRTHNQFHAQWKPEAKKNNGLHPEAVGGYPARKAPAWLGAIASQSPPWTSAERASPSGALVPIALIACYAVFVLLYPPALVTVFITSVPLSSSAVLQV
ncbi:hypothetical protein BJ912DRAFT_1065467 [Pholiota molesta]|nr:hypothetical protein BJ912DRAFT_1065467 [Pholiota molesta]